ncbi:phosphatase PAP2 family protein [Botrimarina hoheduenensis]|uniref:PAP2 superfamily protein n=1 Tax=Botrimarina hoheduenensis TaxID=2528000 RepID=A0A5C5WC81_9BACT|nr:phosphatase PAP2 family protein [Botrimarina hoheduenensis]TWT47631.1 PAP2 superfamily protein [Botrimarina hoheduenensis]
MPTFIRIRVAGLIVLLAGASGCALPLRTSRRTENTAPPTNSQVDRASEQAQALGRSENAPQAATKPPLFGPPTLAEHTALRFDQEPLSEEVTFESDGPRAAQPGLLVRLVNDQREFYKVDSLLVLGGAVAVAGFSANSQLDRDIDRHFQASVRGATADDWFESLHAGKELGNGLYTLPVYGGCWVLGELLPESETAGVLGDWGQRTTRSFLVGAPMTVALQAVLGGSRPGETVNDSGWTPFDDNNGVSGHSFMGSLPFLAAAKMSERPRTKALFYAGSAIAPLSRINDGAHYPSQVMLGWFIAYLAADAVDATETGFDQMRLIPYATPTESGVAVEVAY